MVEQSPSHTRVKGSNPATAAGSVRGIEGDVKMKLKKMVELRIKPRDFVFKQI